MPQEPNARHRRAKPTAPPSPRHDARTFRALRPPFSASFPPTASPFSRFAVFPTEHGAAIPLALPPSPVAFPSSAPEATSPSTPVPFTLPPGNLPATSREFYKTFHASLTASVSFPPTKQRILVWIEFLMEIPSGSRPTPFDHPPPPRHRFPTSAVLGDIRECDFLGRAIRAGLTTRRVRRPRGTARRRTRNWTANVADCYSAATTSSRSPRCGSAASLHFATAGFREQRISSVRVSVARLGFRIASDALFLLSSGDIGFVEG